MQDTTNPIQIFSGNISPLLRIAPGTPLDIKLSKWFAPVKNE